MSPICPQCKQPIEGIDVTRYAVGWCERDVHHACLALHVRSCQPCRVHNEPLVNQVLATTETAA